jgi:PEP-utilizing family enzyme/pfkB family carbohydrate kinase
MKTAAAIVTSHGGRTCHAAIVARELGVPAVVGAAGAVEKLATGRIVTVSCADGEVGKVYDGELPFEVTRIASGTLPRPRTAIMVNLGNPELAYHTAMLPNDGVGLARMEFIINEHIGVHPMALVHPEKIASKKARNTIARLVRDFVEKLAEGVGTIAAAFYPRPVIVRLSDFKTNEYASLIGGAAFEPKEENPMLGFRGAARYSHPAYATGFALECQALARVRNEMGRTNLRVMVPFCRRVAGGKAVIETMARHGLKRGENGLEVYVMCEIPNNVIQIDAFARLFDGFSIGSNDLTQLTLGVDRDSEIVAFDFDERDPGMLEMLRFAVTGAKRNHRHVGSAGRRRRTIRKLRSSSPRSASIRSASMRRACCGHLPPCTRPSSRWRRPALSRRSKPRDGAAAMATIVALTMNPALDIATSTDRVEPTHKLRCSVPRYDPGCGGINVARAVHALGGDAVAIFPVGGPAGEMIRHMLQQEGVAHHTIPISGFTRESLAIEELTSGKQFRLILPGPELSPADQERCLDELSAAAEAPNTSSRAVACRSECPMAFTQGSLSLLDCRARALSSTPLAPRSNRQASASTC